MTLEKELKNKKLTLGERRVKKLTMTLWRGSTNKMLILCGSKVSVESISQKITAL